MLPRVLSPEDDALLAAERETLGRLQRVLARHDAATPDQEALAQSVRRLDDLFLLVVVGSSTRARARSSTR